MKRLKEMMKGYRIKTFGKYRVEKEIAHWFDEELNEHFFWMYFVYNIETGKECI